MIKSLKIKKKLNHHINKNKKVAQKKRIKKLNQVINNNLLEKKSLTMNMIKVLSILLRKILLMLFLKNHKKIQTKKIK